MDAKVRKIRTLADQAFAELSASGFAAIATQCSDVSLIVNKAGKVVDCAADSDTFLLQTSVAWKGKLLVDCVSVESRAKVDLLLGSGRQAAPSRWRQVNHPIEGQSDLPMSYRSFRLRKSGDLLLIGRDLRPMAAMQQDLMDLQHSMELDYARRHQTEARYRLLFQMTAEAVMIVDVNEQAIVEANPAAADLMATPVAKMPGKTLRQFFEADALSQLAEHLASVRSLGKAALESVLTRDGTELSVTSSLLRQDDGALYLLHLQRDDHNVNKASDAAASPPIADILELSPDGFVVTDLDGRILHVNDAFLEMCQLATDMQVHNQPLDNWLGRQGVDVNVLRKNLRQRGSVRHYVTTLRSEYGATVDVELSAVAAIDAATPCLGFVVRRTLKSAEVPRDYATQPLSQSLEEMTDLVGRVPLKDLVRETTDLIERMCIEAALKLTTNNRASAADMLGLSRQSLYVKLRRYGIGDAETLPENEH